MLGNDVFVCMDEGGEPSVVCINVCFIEESQWKCPAIPEYGTHNLCVRDLTYSRSHNVCVRVLTYSRSHNVCVRDLTYSRSHILCVRDLTYSAGYIPGCIPFFM